MGIQYSLVNIVWGAVFTSEYCMVQHPLEAMGVQYSPGGSYSLVNNVCGV